MSARITFVLAVVAATAAWVSGLSGEYRYATAWIAVTMVLLYTGYARMEIRRK